MELGLTGRVALVTGASRGIGAACARRLAEEGATLVVVARGEEDLKALAKSLTGPNANAALALPCDVTSADDIAKAVGAAMARFGGVDILVNNAGGLTTRGLAAFDDLSDETFLATYTLNVLSALRFIRGVLPSMRAKKWGRIVNISSESGVQPDPIGADYNASKAALNALAKTLSKALAADGILVNTVSPAFTKGAGLKRGLEARAKEEGKSVAEVEAAMLQSFRPNIVVKRAGEPEEIAAAVAFLCSEAASFVTGAVLRVDGGSVASVGG